MNFEIAEDQEMLRDNFARFLDQNSSIERVRRAEESGFDADLWQGLGELGAFLMRVPEDAGGLGLGTFDAAILMDEAGRTLVSGPLAEAMVAVPLLARFGGEQHPDLLTAAIEGRDVVGLAFHDIAETPRQWVAGGAVARAVLARRGDDLVLVALDGMTGRGEETLASTAPAELDLASGSTSTLASGRKAVDAHARAVEEWKILMAAGLNGLAREAIRYAAEYACERKQFGKPIGAYQAISHPLADCLSDVDGGKFLAWKAIRDIADATADAAGTLSLAFWWNVRAASRAVAQALQTFGGYGLTTEYDIYLFNLRAKAWPLVYGDPQLVLEEAGNRLYGGASAPVPDVGDLPIEFGLGDEADDIVREIDEFFERHVTPEMREAFHYSWEGYNPELHRKLAKAKLLFLGAGEELGSRNVSPYTRIAAMEAFERQGYNHPAANVAEMVGLMISRFGSDELKQDVLSKITSGEVICSLGYSEPGSGSDVFAAQCKATRDGNGWRIDGTKMFTSGANLADYVLMLTRTNPDVPKHAGLTMFVVPLKTEGVSIQAVHTFQDERTNITFYDGVKIPDSYRLGEVDGGVRTMSVGLELEHGGGFGKSMRGMLHAAEELCREIEVDGAPLIEKPHARSRLAHAAANVMVSDLLAFRAGWASIEKKPNHAYGPMAKMFSSETFLESATDLLELTAPLSLSKRKGAAALVNQSYRHAHGTRIYGGTSEIHRSMIAERALGLPRTRA